MRWYDREDHKHFDVCADDHCQRYQGITKAANKHVVEAIKQTAGEILTSVARFAMHGIASVVAVQLKSFNIAGRI